jgi:hypothetical protein
MNVLIMKVLMLIIYECFNYESVNCTYEHVVFVRYVILIRS